MIDLTIDETALAGVAAHTRERGVRIRPCQGAAGLRQSSFFGTLLERGASTDSRR